MQYRFSRYCANTMSNGQAEKGKRLYLHTRTDCLPMSSDGRILSNGFIFIFGLNRVEQANSKGCKCSAKVSKQLFMGRLQTSRF